MSAAEKPGSQQDAAANQQIIIVVDGRPLRLFHASIFLQRARYQVIMAKTAEDARLFLGMSVPQAIISDFDLPDQGGLELLKQTRQDHRTRNVPFIICSADRDPEVRRSCEAAGSSAYLIHPVSLEALYKAVQKATQAKPRNFVRLTTALDVVVGDNRPTDIARQDLIVAISENGMFVSTDKLLEIGTILPFTFHLPSAPGWFFRIEGQVLYTHAGADNRKLSGMAVKFLKMGDQERELLQDFIRQGLLEGIAPTPSTG
jgi:two-component system, chemotaxis family, response regulator PixH